MLIDAFEKYILKEKQAAENTVNAYIKDLEHFEEFLAARGIHDLTAVSNADIVAYVMELKKNGKSKSTVNRKLTSIRTFYKFLVKEGKVRVIAALGLSCELLALRHVGFSSCGTEAH